MKKIATILSMAVLLSACGGDKDPVTVKGYDKDGIPTTESGFYESASSEIGQEFLSNVQDTIIFGYDSFILSDEAKMILDKQAEFIAGAIGVKIVIEGHTDERGTREYNLALGEKRASIVKKYLMKKGVDAKSINAISYGKERPASEMHDAEAWAKNRRAVTIIM